MKKILLLSLVTLFVACGPNENQKVATSIAQIWGADSCIIGISSGDEKSITLTIKNPKVKADYPNENITSMSAFTYIHKVPSEEYTRLDNIKVTIKNNSSTFEKTYKITDVLKAEAYFEIVDDFSKKIINGNLKGIESYFATKIISDTTITEIKNGILDLISKNGKPDKSTITYFDFNTLEKTKEPVVVINFVASNATFYSDFKLIFRQSDKKIIFIGLN